MNAKEIKELRQKLGLTQEALARKLGVSYWTILRWENGSHLPSPLALQALQKLRKG